MGFVHLHCHTQYSLLDGAIRIADLIKTTRAFGQEAVAITDHGVMYGALDFYDKATEAGLKPIIGCEVYVAPGSMESRDLVPGMPKYFHLILLAMDNIGYHNLMRLVSLAHTRGFYYKPRVDRKTLEELNKGLIAMSACLQGEIPYWLLRDNAEKAGEAMDFYRRVFDGRFYLEIQDNGLPDQDKVNPLILDLGLRSGIPVAATNDCHYLRQEDAKAHEVLLCIQTQNTIHDKSRMSFETDQLYLKSPEEMALSFQWAPQAVDITSEIALRCTVDIPRGMYYFPVYPTAPGKNLEEVIEERSWEGLRSRMGGDVPELYGKRLAEELEIIKSMGFAGYFLIVSDYIQYAKDHGIPVGPGRGSAAGSLVAYGLRITDIDPIRWKLLFERFLNPERRSMPDIDVDFCQTRRDEVIEYVKNKYGPEYVSQITTFGNMKAKAVIRDVARVLGISYAEADRIAKLIPTDIKITLDDALSAEPRLRELMEKDPEVARLLEIAKALEGLNRHASVHAGGVIISDSQKLTEHVPVYVDKKGMLISQYDMKCIERVGLIKFDMLGLKTLTVIAKTLEILKAQGIGLDIEKLPLDDKKTYQLIGDGETASVFQLESSGMRNMLRQFRPEKFEDIIAAVALYRPGPMDLIPAYVDRRHGRQKIDYPHPLVEAILEETYGIIVYQEQVMQIAQEMAGYSLGKADLLRRAMGKKKHEEMAKQRAIFIEGASAKGVDQDKAGEIFDLMEKFADYGFNKSHAAAYALVSYQTAYLKAHHFREFMAANLTLDLNNTDKVSQHIAECRKKSVAVLPPDINESSFEFVTTTEGIRFGLGAIKNVGKGAVEGILAERQENGPFPDIASFLDRVVLLKVNRRVVESLIKAGAFDRLHPNRRAMSEMLDVFLEDAQRKARSKLDNQATLFSLEEFTHGDAYQPRELPDIPDWPEAEKLKMEKDGMGFYLSGHPLTKYAALIDRYATATTLSLRDAPSTVVLAGVLSSVNVTRTKRGEAMARGVIEDLEGSAPILFFPQCFGKYQALITAEEPVIIKARADRGEDGGSNDSDAVSVDLIAEEVMPLEGADELLAKKVLVRIPPGMRPDGLRAIKEAIMVCSGSCSLSFEVDTEEALVNIDAGKKYMVLPGRDFMKRLCEIVGPKGVELW